MVTQNAVTPFYNNVDGLGTSVTNGTFTINPWIWNPIATGFLAGAGGYMDVSDMDLF